MHDITWSFTLSFRYGVQGVGDGSESESKKRLCLFGCYCVTMTHAISGNKREGILINNYSKSIWRKYYHIISFEFYGWKIVAGKHPSVLRDTAVRVRG